MVWVVIALVGLFCFAHSAFVNHCVKRLKHRIGRLEARLAIDEALLSGKSVEGDELLETLSQNYDIQPISYVPEGGIEIKPGERVEIPVTLKVVENDNGTQSLKTTEDNPAYEVE